MLPVNEFNTGLLEKFLVLSYWLRPFSFNNWKWTIIVHCRQWNGALLSILLFVLHLLQKIVTFFELLIYPSVVPASSFEYFPAFYLLSIRIDAARWEIIADLLIINYFSESYWWLAESARVHVFISFQHFCFEIYTTT